MEGDILKNTGRLFLSLIIFLILSGGLYAVEIETELSPSRISAGESATLRIKVTGKSAGVKPVKFPAVNGLQITFSGSSRNFQFINGKTWSGTVLSFSIYGEKKGEYKIPPFILEADGERVSSREVTLIVGESASGRSTAGTLRGDIDLSAETVYAGEPFIIRYFVEDNSGIPIRVEGFSEQPHVKGFVMKGLDEQAGDSDKIYAGSFCLVPVEKGVHQIGGGSVVVSADNAQGFFSMRREKKIDFPYKKINVIPIPSDGKPEFFSGDVGEFKIEAQIPSGEFKLFDEIKIPVKISGRGNLLTLSRPRVGNEEEVKIIVEEREQTLSVSEGGLSGEKNFLITIIPQRDGNINAGKVFIDYFNPYKKIFEKAETGELEFTVVKSENSGEKGEVQFTPDSSLTGRSVYVYAIIIISSLIILVIVLVMWERKKFKMIKSELGTDSPAETAYPEVNKRDEILLKITAALENNDNELFLLNADRGINLIDPLKLSPDDNNRYNQYKEKVYNSRYGGGKFAEAEMSELALWLKRNMK
ncbi:MAG: hypothetical protein CVV49_20915 [Spirochaetae bacterium HGW-Spirochaetae-5]|nr:MAG: hypothetical protein CVV49_20915 [Spirochaetae bacterium HGW-Spirochaetae-5]